MQFASRIPSPPLRAHVAYLWTVRDAPAHAHERIVPSGTVELVFNLHDDAFRILAPGGAARTFGGALVSGCYATAFTIETRAHAHVVGVHFHPGGAARLLGVPPGLLADDHVGLADLWGADAARLREQLCAAPSLEARFALLESALCARLGAPPRADIAAAVASLATDPREVGRVAAALALSHRRFIELFTREVGMTPKRFAIVQRFQRALAAAEATPLARLAVEHGYYDQAHLCRDWRALTGLSPQAFLGARAVAVKANHVAVPVKSVQGARAPHR